MTETTTSSAPPYSESLLTSIIESSSDAILTKTLEGIVTSWNRGAERMYGYTAQEMIGKSITTLTPPERKAEIANILRRIGRGERVEHFETDRVHKNGRVLRVSLTISPILSNGEVVGASAIARDVTRRHQAEEILQGQRRLLELVARSAPLEEILTSLVETVESYSRDDVIASILLLDRDGKRLRVGAAPGLPKAYNEAIDGIEIGPNVGSCGTAAYLGKPVIVTDVTTDPLWADYYPLALEHGLRACWSTPILSTRDEILGTFAIYYREPHEPSTQDQILLAVFNRTAAIAIERNRAEEDLRRQTHTLEILSKVNASLAAELDHDKLVQTVTDAGTELTGAQFGAFFYNVTRDDGGAYMLYSLSGVPAEAFSKFPMPRATDLFGPIFRGEGAMRLDDVTLDPRYGKSAPYHGMPEGHLPVRSFLAVPVISRSRQVLGGLFFGHSEVGVFRSRHEEIAIGIAAQAAIALDNARLFEQARAQARELADANERKNDFLALLAHELRNPLGAIGNALALAEAADGRSDVISEAFGIVRRQSSYITRLVDDLFDVSRIGRGMVELEREKLELRQVVEHAIESIMPQLETRRQRLELEMPAEAVPVKGDPVRLGQVVTNLLSNASKHSPEDCRIWLEVERKKRWVQLTVRDEGMGIEPDFLPRVFDLFARGGRDNGRSSPPGLGIGLTLVRQLVELHEGEIEARSKGPGQGSEFRVRLPLTPEGTQATRPEAVTVSEVEPAEPAKPAGLRVLLVDDHREAVTALQALLELWGHKVRVAFDGPSALELARQYPPELVLLDIGLPEMDGWEVASRLRQRPETAAATLIALTGFGQETDRARSREAGFDHHLVKPVNPQALKNYLIEWTSEPSEPS